MRFVPVQPAEISCLVDLQKCHITKSRYEVSSVEIAQILTSSHHDALIRNGAAPRDRTGDTQIFSLLLYQLSYLPEMAEEVGFEPAEPFDPTVFKTVAINRSATPPKNKNPAWILPG